MREVRKEVELRRHGGVGDERVEPAHVPEREHHRHDRAHHHEREEEEVRVHHPAQAAERGVDDHADLDRAERHERHHDEVEQDAEVESAETAQERGRLPRIAQLVELDVRRHAGTPPQLRVHEHGEHPREEERPPLPVAADAALVADQLREEVRAVRGRGGGHHRDAEQPPGHRPPREEELLRARRALPARERRNQDQHEEKQPDHRPVEAHHRLRGSSKQRHFHFLSLRSDDGGEGLRGHPAQEKPFRF